MKQLKQMNCKYVCIAFVLLIIIVFIQIVLNREGLNVEDKSCNTKKPSDCNSKSNCMWNEIYTKCLDTSDTSCNSLDYGMCRKVDKCRWDTVNDHCSYSYCKVIGTRNTYAKDMTTRMSNCTNNSKCYWSRWSPSNDQCQDLDCNYVDESICNLYPKCLWDIKDKKCNISQDEKFNVKKKSDDRMSDPKRNRAFVDAFKRKADNLTNEQIAINMRAQVANKKREDEQRIADQLAQNKRDAEKVANKKREGAQRDAEKVANKKREDEQRIADQLAKNKRDAEKIANKIADDKRNVTVPKPIQSTSSITPAAIGSSKT
jgi:hypothetical protein